MQIKQEPGDPRIGMMTVHDVADYLRVSEAKIYKMAKGGNVPALRIGRSWRFKKDLIDNWILRETEKGLNIQSGEGVRE